MVVLPKQICKRFLPDTGESRNDKPFFLKTNMELEACTSLGSMFHRRGALLVKKIRPANDAGWNGRKSPCCRPRVRCWCSWKLSFSRSNAGADCWWQRWMVVTSWRANDETSESALIFWSAVRHYVEDEHLPGIERPFSRASLVDLVDQTAWTGWLLKQHTPNLAESLRR